MEDTRTSPVDGAGEDSGERAVDSAVWETCVGPTTAAYVKVRENGVCKDVVGGVWGTYIEMKTVGSVILFLNHFALT